MAPTSGPAPAEESTSSSPDRIEGPDGRSYALNTWLLDESRPENSFVTSGAEPAILADRDGEHLWIASTGGGYRSSDDGQTWEEFTTPFLLVADGWSLAQDGNGDLYASTTGTAHIEVWRSTDDGQTWQIGSHIAGAAPIADRPWIAAHGDGEVALFYYDFGRTFSESCVRSTDGGTTWQDRYPLAGTPQGGNAIYDDDGNLYYVDDDGNLRKYAPNLVSQCASLSDRIDMFSGSKSEGAQPMIQAAVDDSTDAVYSAAPSHDNGKIWLAGTKDMQDVRHLNVSTPELESNTFATVSAQDGSVAVAWYGSETPGDPSRASYDGTWNVFLAVVEGFWTDDPTVEHYRLTDEPNHFGDICMDGIGCGSNQDRDLLDYFMATHDVDGDIHVAYGDDAGHPPDVFHARIPGS